MSREVHPSVRRFSGRPAGVPKDRQILGMSIKEAKAHATGAGEHPDLTALRARALLKRFEKTG
jgi:hypothetical protein